MGLRQLRVPSCLDTISLFWSFYEGAKHGRIRAMGLIANPEAARVLDRPFGPLSRAAVPWGYYMYSIYPLNTS